MTPRHGWIARDRWNPEALLARFGEALERVKWPGVLAVAVCAAFPASAHDLAQARATSIVDKSLEDRVEPYIRASAHRDTLDLATWLPVAGLLKMWRGTGAAPAVLTISVDTPGGYNVATAATAAGYDVTKPLNVIVIVNTGIYVGGRITATSASFAGNTSLKFINNGYICGAGGAGNAGNGGDAMFVNFPFTIDNTNGYILAGGGGGGLGGVCAQATPGACQGGGGGGGFGYPVGVGGGPQGGGNAAQPGQNANRANMNIGGYGGPGGSDSFYGTSGGGGGMGGGAGAAGAQGGYASDGGIPSPGGNPGNAINTAFAGGGAIITWVGGYNGTQVKGNIV